MRRFYLTGHHTFANRGCEAIVRSTVLMLHKVFGEVEILVPSSDIQRDKEQWPEAAQFGVRFVQAYLPAYTRYWVNFLRFPFKCLKRASWPFPFPKHLLDDIKSVDAVLSVGGDNYSLDYRLPSMLMGIDKLSMRLGKPVFIWGASVGPFESEPHFVPTIIEHLSNMKVIFARETVTSDYLTKKLFLRNVKQMADPAFTLPKQQVEVTSFWPDAGTNGVIGFNISPLIERYKTNDQDLRTEAIQFIHDAVARGFGVLLVPHVIPLDGSVKGNDAIYMANMLDDLKLLGGAVSTMPSYFNASQIKHVISQLRFFIGARTHATIAALSSGVPTLSISYSVKARGINRDLLGELPVVLPTTELTANSLMTGLNYLIENEAHIESHLAKQLPKWCEQVEISMREIKSLIMK